MSAKKIRILHVEDNDEEIRSRTDSVGHYNHKNSKQVEVISARSLEDAKSNINEELDGVIIDLNLNDDPSAGEAYREFLKTNLIRVPSVVLTGTPDNITHEALLKIYTKGEDNSAYNKIFDYFWEIYDTGITKIMGARGLIEELLYKVFSEAINPYMGSWVDHAKANAEETEASLLRYTINHLHFLSKNNTPALLPEEFYIKTTICGKQLNTGSIYHKEGTNYIVITPTCDFAQRAIKHIQVIEIEAASHVYSREAKPKINDKGETEYNSDNVRELKRNNKGNCYHYLPHTEIFCGGYINFRKIKFLDYDFDAPSVDADAQVSPFFMKDIISRFSSYYARQGQPNIAAS